jgi:hypothetical protein
LGAIVFWTIIRTAILIPIIWILQSYIPFNFWSIISITAIYGLIIHPAVLHYRLFEEKNKEIIESTLCSSCKHFDRSAVLCMKYDKHPTMEYLPCGGEDWEPKSVIINNKDIIDR